MRRHPMLALSVLVPAFSVGAQQVSPTTPATGRIAGRVNDPQSGQPAVGANVVLRVRGDTIVVRAVTTDAAGAFVFDSLAPGRYRLQAAVTGLDSAGQALLGMDVRLASGRRRHVTLARPPQSAFAAGPCGEDINAHPSSTEIIGLPFGVQGGASGATLARIRPGDQGLKAQYTVVEGCRPVPLSERGVLPPG